MPNVVDVRTEIVRIKKIVTKLYDRLVVVDLVVETIIPIVEVPNIWEDSMVVQAEETRE